MNANGVVWNLTKYNNKLYFMYNDGSTGLELWTSDGTTAGTFLLKDIFLGALSSQPEHLTVCNGLLFFQASTAARNQGLWVTDGTAIGTQMLGNQYANPFGSTNGFIVMNNKIYFEGNAGLGYGLWESNGTTIGTLLVKSGSIGISGGSHAVLGNTFYFQNGDNIIGQELWKSDGTIAGTVLVKDINTGGFSSSPEYFFSDGNKVYFIANNGINGKELWTTDGTLPGTQMVKDVSVGNADSSPNYAVSSMFNLNSETYFFARNGANLELYKTTGTPAGTVLVKSIANLAYVIYTYQFNGKVYFIVSNTIGGLENLFQTDGTAAGTFQVNVPISTYATNPNGFNMLSFANELYLASNFGSQGNELCKISNLLSTNIFAFDDEVSVYPNPTCFEINVKVPNEIIKSEVRIFNATSQLISTFFIKNNLENIDLSSFSSGMYFLEIQTQKKVIRKKILKQ